MNVRRVVPNITSERREETVDFFVGLLGFDVAMETDWVTTVVSPSNRTAQLNIMHANGGPPAGSDTHSAALRPPQLSIEVEDVDAVYAAALRRGLHIAYPITDESWGVRRFFVTEPNGLVINILTHL
jgi:catechol 2,3-dioxygenase-like lactoylglutathione lyase family enzyme